MNCIRSLLKDWQNWNGEGSVQPILKTLLPHLNDNIIWSTFDLAEMNDQSDEHVKKFTLEHVGILKLTCDQLFIIFSEERLKEIVTKKQ